MKLLLENILTEDGTYSTDKELWYRGSHRANSLDIEDGVKYNTTEQYGPGIYFTNRYETALGYGTVGLYKIPVKGFYTTKNRIDIKKIQEIIEYMDDKEALSRVLSDWDEDYETKPHIAMNLMLKSIKDYCKHMPDALAQIAHDVFHDDAKEFLMCCRAANVNGVIINEVSYSYLEEKYLILYNPKLAKSIESDLTI